MTNSSRFRRLSRAVAIDRKTERDPSSPSGKTQARFFIFCALTPAIRLALSDADRMVYSEWRITRDKSTASNRPDDICRADIYIYIYYACISIYSSRLLIRRHIFISREKERTRRRRNTRRHVSGSATLPCLFYLDRRLLVRRKRIGRSHFLRERRLRRGAWLAIEDTAVFTYRSG